MRLVWVVIPLVLIGIIGIQSVEGQISPGSPFAADLSINNPPNLGETANVTLTFVNAYGYNRETVEQFPVIIRLPDGLELVSGELETTHFWQQGDTLDVTVTVQAIQTGNWTIQGVGFRGASDYLYLVIDEDSSYIHEGNFPSSTLPKYPVEKYREFYDELTQYKAPLKQIRDNGVLPKDVKCNEGKVLFFKASDNSPACVKPATAEKLMERGWAINKESQRQYEVDSNCELAYLIQDNLENNHEIPFKIDEEQIELLKIRMQEEAQKVLDEDQDMKFDSKLKRQKGSELLEMGYQLAIDHIMEYNFIHPKLRDSVDLVTHLSTIGTSQKIDLLDTMYLIDSKYYLEDPQCGIKFNERFGNKTFDNLKMIYGEDQAQQKYTELKDVIYGN